MKFYKYQGAGNDFLIADNRNGNISEKDGVLTSVGSDGTIWSAAISDLCDRRYGIGADGLMLLEAGADGLDFHMTYFNSDGSGGMMCGNGGRCIVAFAADMDVIPSGEQSTYLFDAADGLHTAQVLEDEGGIKIVRLKMKDVSEAVHYDELTGVSCVSDGWFLDTGTRHYVRQICDLESYDIVSEGREIRYGAQELMPVGANVNFIEPSGNTLRVRTYEKGVEDETFACGTGIVASAIAAYLSGVRPSFVQEDTVIYDIRAKRDSLRVDFRSCTSGSHVAEDVFLTGPAAFVAEVIF